MSFLLSGVGPHADARKIVLVEEVVQWEADEDIFGLDLNRIVHRYCHLT